MSYILFGSQTGQAKSIAENLFETLNPKNNNFKLFELDDIDKFYYLDKIKVAIIVCSTTGDGDAPENASKFLRKIKSYSANSFTFRYTVLGLGDTNYSNFCNCGKMIDSVLSIIGGKRFYNSRWADDAVGLEIVVEPWLENVYNAIHEVSGDELIQAMERITVFEKTEEAIQQLNADATELLGDLQAVNIGCTGLTAPLLPEPFLQIDYDYKNVCKIDKCVVSSLALPADKSGLQLAQLTEIKRITEKYAIKTVHKVTLSMNTSDWTWSPGDSIGILPCNPRSEVEAILSRLGLSSEMSRCPISFIVNPNTKKKNPKIPEHLVVASSEDLSLENVFSWLCDIRSPLSKAGLRIMAEFCANGSREQQRLLQLCSKEGQMLYLRCIREPSLPLLDLLNWFPSCKIPVERLLEVLPRLKPRAYSLCDLDTLSFAFSKVNIAPVQQYRKRPLTGICTTWLESLMTRTSDEVTIPIYIRKNLNGFTVSNPEDAHILIGPGTGVAPFISFLQYFESLKKRGDKVGPVWLFFGCRNRERDFIFRAEMERFLAEGVLTHLCLCFSRDTGPSVPCPLGPGPRACIPRNCTYVQDCLMHHRAELSSLVLGDHGQQQQQQARIYVCGDAAGLAKDVLATWPEVLTRAGHGRKEAEALVARMRINKTYLEDVWL